MFQTTNQILYSYNMLPIKATNLSRYDYNLLRKVVLQALVGQCGWLTGTPPHICILYT